MTTVDVIFWYDFSPLEFVKTWDLTSDVSRAELLLPELLRGVRLKLVSTETIGLA